MDPLLFGLDARHEPGIAAQVLAIFREVMFGKAVGILTKGNAQAHRAKILAANAAGDALAQALRSGRVQYEAGVFSGNFSAAISRDIMATGARFVKFESVYKLDPARVPGWVVAEATVYASAAKAMHHQLLRAFDDAQENLNRALETKSVDATLAIGELASGWKDAATVLEVNPELSHPALDRLRRKYDENMKLYIRDFANEEIPELRQIVRENAEQGYRADRLIQAIEGRYDVSKSKATFLAKQETSLLVSKFREERFRETVGDRYTWLTSGDQRVRHDHRILNGKEFSYDHPPVTNLQTGAKNNPGEDFGCRCVARPVLRAKQREKLAA